jgi:hypothetical protein
MNIKQLRKVLVIEANHLREDGKSEKADAVASFANLLEGSDQMEVSEFVDRVEKARQRADLSPVRPNRRRGFR